MSGGFLPTDMGKDMFFFNATLVENIISSKRKIKRERTGTNQARIFQNFESPCLASFIYFSTGTNSKPPSPLSSSAGCSSGFSSLPDLAVRWLYDFFTLLMRAFSPLIK